MERPYHLAVVGVRLPHLALAALMAKRGRKVLVLEERESVPPLPSERIGGYIFRKRPVPLFGLDDRGILRRLLDEIGIGHLLVRSAYPPNPVSYQVVLPRHRLDIHADRSALAEEVAREFPAASGDLRSFYQECDHLAEIWYRDYEDPEVLEGKRPPTFSWLKGRMKVLLAARGRPPAFPGTLSPEPLSFLDVQHRFLGSYPPGGLPPPLSLALMHAVGRRGTFQEPAGTSSLSSLLITRLLEYGGTVEFGAKVEKVVPQGKSGGFTLYLAGGENRVAQTVAVGASSAVSLGLPVKTMSADRRNPTLVPLRFYLGMREDYVPAGMADNVFFLREDEGGPLRIRTLYLAMSPKGSRMAPEGRRSLTVTALAPPSLLAAHRGRPEGEITDDLLAALESVIPFVLEGMELMRSDWSAAVETLPRPLGSGLPAWSPILAGRSRVRSALRGRALLFSSAPWELGCEGEALMTLAAAGLTKKTLGQE